jgi:hypothetical protein
MASRLWHNGNEIAKSNAILGGLIAESAIKLIEHINPSMIKKSTHG